MESGRADVPRLVRDLGAEDDVVRDAALRALLEGDEPAVERLLLRVVAEGETSLLLRREAGRVLHLLSLRRDLGHVRAQVRDQAVRMLASFGDDARLALEPALRDGDPTVQANARRALEALAKALPSHKRA